MTESTRAQGALPVRHVKTARELSELVAELLDTPIYAIDTEFHRERTYYPRLALVQVAFGDEVALIDPLATSFEPFAAVLAGGATAVFHAADQDLEVLAHACGTLPAVIFDTQITAGFIGLSTPSLQSLVDRLLGVRLEKTDQLTDWTRRPLSDTQLDYAASDVKYLLELAELLRADLSSRGRLTWADEECALLLERQKTSAAPETAWWRLRQARQLKGVARGVAQSVAAWRERRARQLDIPLRHVLSDLAVISIAQRPPATREELEQVRALDIRHLQGGAFAELLEAVEEGRHLAKDALALPVISTGAVSKPAVVLAAAWANARAADLEIDPAIFATRADLADYLHDPPTGRLVSTWRAELVGDAITRLVSGKVSIVLDGLSLHLEERSYRGIDENDATDGEDQS